MDQQSIKSLMSTLSQARMARYVTLSQSTDHHPLDLYLYNLELSKQLLPALSLWEVAFRNRMDEFLCWKFTARWPYEDRLVRQLAADDRQRLSDARTRQERERSLHPAPRDPIVADLSLGFWVSLFARRYEVPFAWRPGGNLARVFPNLMRPEIRDVQARLDRLRGLRNRIAHHEPILHLDLPRYHQDAMDLTRGLCPAAAALIVLGCGFKATWSSGPGTAVAAASAAGKTDQDPS